MSATMMSAAAPERSLTGMALYKTGLPVAIVGAYFFFRMFYFLDFEAQIADILLVGVSLFLISINAVKDQYEQCKWVFFMFALMIAENFIWFAITSERDVGLSMLYYIYNFIALCLVYAAREERPDLFDKYIPRIIVLAFITELVLMRLGLFTSGLDFRNSGTFTNPNQLAFWTLCLLTIVLMLRKRGFVIPTLAIGLAGYLILMSVSRGALMGYVALVAIYFFQRVASIHARIIAALIVATGAFLVFGSPLLDNLEDDFVLAQRLETRAVQRSAVDELEIRNYTRLTQDSRYLILGAGEGAFYRFNGERYKYGAFANIEIHSTVLTVLFSYGIIGLVIFLGLILQLLKASIWDGIYLGGVMIYGLSHNGLRFTIFWCIVAILISQIAGRRRAATEGRRLAVSTNP